MNVLEARRRLLGAGVYKKTVTGNPAIAQGSLARMYPGIEMNGWTMQDGAPTPETPVPIVSAGTQNQDTGKWEYEIEVTGANLLNEKSVRETASLGITVEWLEDEGCFLLNGTCISTHAFALTDINLKGNIGSNYTVSVHKISGDVSVPDGGFCVAYFGVNDSPASGGTPKENWLLSPIENEVPATGALNRKYINTFWFYITEGVSLVNCKLNVMLEQGNTATSYEPYHTPQTVTIQSDRTLTKWDKLEKRNGQWGWVYKSEEIESYTDESVPGEYYSTTGQLSVGAQVWYEAATETFVPLSPEEQEQMNALYTFRPTTVLSNDCECNMSLTYKTKKSMGGGNLLDYRKLINLDKWSPVGSAYRHFDISFKPKTTYKISVSVNNMHKGYKKDYEDKFALYLGEIPNAVRGNTMFGNTGSPSVRTERTFTTSENPFYLNLYVSKWNSENLHIVFDELLPNIKLEEVTT